MLFMEDVNLKRILLLNIALIVNTLNQCCRSALVSMPMPIHAYLDPCQNLKSQK
jgi:hypothetical protein